MTLLSSTANEDFNQINKTATLAVTGLGSKICSPWRPGLKFLNDHQLDHLQLSYIFTGSAVTQTHRGYLLCVLFLYFSLRNTVKPQGLVSLSLVISVQTFFAGLY